MRAGLAFIAAVAASASVAWADDTVEVRYIGEGIGRVITLFGSQVGGQSFSFQIGQQVIEARNGIGEGAFLNGVFPTFCTDLGQGDWGGFQVFKVAPLADAPLPGPSMGPIKAQAIADAWFAAGGQQFTSQDYAAGLQMLIWDIIYDYNGSLASLSPTTGTVRFSSAGSYFATDIGIFNALRAHIGDNHPLDGLRALTHPDFQDQIAIIPSPGGAAGLAIAGLLLAVTRRRR